MKKFIILVRETETPADKPNEQELKDQRAKWDQWFGKYRASGNFIGGSGLVSNGKMIKGGGAEVINQAHHGDNERVAGYLLIKAETLDEAVEIAKELPTYRFGGYTEVRELRVDD